MAEKFIARQPIFGRDMKVFAYELLFRASCENRAEPTPTASQSVIVDSMMVFHLERLIGPAKAFVNVDEKALVSEAAKLLDPRRVVLELLEHVNPTTQVIEACQDLRRRGYELAIDDFAGEEKWNALMPLVNFLKVDYMDCGEEVQRTIAEQYCRKESRCWRKKWRPKRKWSVAGGSATRTFKGSFFASRR